MKAFLQHSFTKITFAVFLLNLVFNNGAFAQATSILTSGNNNYTIGGSASGTNFTTFTAAITALNNAYTANLTGTVTFTVTSGKTYTEVAYPLIINDNANNPTVVFKTDGVSTNPVIQSAAAGSGTVGALGTISTLAYATNQWGTAFVILNGTDNITFNGIDLTDIYSASAALDMKVMNIGYALVRNGGGDGCQNDIIENCNITMSPSYVSFSNSSYGIVQESTNKGGTATAPTTGGQHMNNKFYGNVIKNVSGGIIVAGTTQPTAPFALYDQGCQVGGTGAGQGNTITNYGGASTVIKFGIYTTFETGISIAGNTISNGTATDGLGSALYGVVLISGVNINIFNNKICGLSSTLNPTTSPFIAGIFFNAKTGSTGPYYIYNNFIGDLTCINDNKGLPSLAGIYLFGSGSGLASPGVGLYYNTVWLNNTSSSNTAALYIANNTTTKDIRNNIFDNTSLAGTNYTAAIGRGAAGFSDLSATTNNNLYYAGFPGTNNLICTFAFPPTTPYQSLCNYQTAVNGGCPGTTGSIESASISYDPDWVNNNVDAATNFLTLAGSQAAIGGGAGMSSPPITINSDFFNLPRATSGHTTIGAQEVTATPSSNTITSGTVSGTSPYCPNSTVTVPFTIGAGNIFSSDNVFSAEISDANGIFSSTAPLGTLAQTGAGTITATIPNVPSGTGYKVRVVSSDPIVIGSPNSIAMTFGAIPALTTGNGVTTTCNGLASASLGYSITTSQTNGPPTQYSITYDAAGTAAGLTPSGLLTLPNQGGSSGSAPMPLPTGGINGSVDNDFTIHGFLQIKDNTTSPFCISLPVAFTYTVFGQISLAMGLNPVVCSGATTANITYTATSGHVASGAWYGLTFDGAALAAGFTNIATKTDKTFSATPPLAIPATSFPPGGAVPGVYNCTLYVKSNSTSCLDSVGFPFTITVTASAPGTPSAPSGPTTVCPTTTSTSTYTTSATNASSYTWTLTAGAGTIVSGSTSATVTWSPTYTGTAVVSVTQVSNGCGNNNTAVSTNVSVSCGFNITASVTGANGTISPNGITQVSSGGSQTYTITPNSCYQVSSVLVDGVSQGAITSYTFSNVMTIHTISVTFAYLPITISVSPSPGLICAGGTTLTASGAGGSGTYIWSPSATLSSSTGANVNASPVSVTTYTVVGTSSAGCTGSATVATVLATPLAGGTYTIGTDFPSIAAAIARLNCEGISGAVTFNVPANYTETFANTTSGIINIPVNRSNSTNTITFQKTGAGADPLITAAVGIGTGQYSSAPCVPWSGTLDGIITLSGTDYVTFDGIDLQENTATPASIATQTEYGYGLVKNSGTDGCQNDIIRNCKISLTSLDFGRNHSGACSVNGIPNDEFPCAIYMDNNTISNLAQLTVTSVNGENSTNSFYGNTITNAYAGIVLNGYNDPSALYYDQNNQVGVAGGNTITSTGTSGFGLTGCIYGLCQNSFTVANNFLYPTESDLSSPGFSLWGVNADQCPGSVTIYGNSIQPSVTASSTVPITGITNNSGGTINIYGNTITAGNLTNATGGLYGIRNSAGCSNLTINNNNISNTTLGSGATFEAIYQTGNVVTALNIYGNTISGNSGKQFNLHGPGVYSSSNGGPTQIYNNVISNNLFATNGYGVEIGGSSPVSVSSNNIYGNSCTNAGSSVFGIRCTATGTTESIFGNTIYNLSSPNGAVDGITNTGNATTINIYGNSVFHLFTPGTTNTISGIANSSGATCNIYNNMIYDLTAPASTNAPSVAGLSITGGTTTNVYYNTVYLNGSSSTAGHKTGAMFISGGTVDLRNNILDNSTSETNGGLAIALYKSSMSNANIATGTSNNNLVYAGIPGSQNLLVSDGLNTTGSTLAVYRSTLSPAETNSVTGDPLFTNTGAYPNEDVHLKNVGLLSPAINSGANITTPISISNDIDGDSRPMGAAGKYDIGADEINELQPVTPSVTAGTNPPCTNSTVTFSTPSIANATGYAWTLPGVLGTDYTISGSSTSNTITVTYLTAKSGNVTSNGVLVPAGSGYTYNGPASSGLAFSSISRPTVTITPSSGNICLGDVLPQTASGASTTYNWSPSTGLDVNTGASVNASPALSVTYTITGTASNGCTNNTTDVVTVKPLPPLVVTPNNAVCTGGTNATLVASGASTYTWSPTTNLIPSNGTGTTETAQISALTIYTVTGTNTSTGCTASTRVPVATVAVGGTISAPFTIICSGGTKALSVSGAAGNDYQWQMSANNATWTNITGATNTTYTTASGDGNSNKFYRMIANSNACWNVASTTAEIDVSNPTITVTAGSITDNSITLNWSPAGTGNYSINYTGTTSGLQSSVTPPNTITGLTANGSYNIVVTQTGVAGCSATGTLSGVKTLCAIPTNLTATSTVTGQINVSWSGQAGNYRVYYRPLYAYVTYFTKDVSNATSVVLTKQGSNNLYNSTTYQVYVAMLDCPNPGNTGQPTSPTYVTTVPSTIAGCATPKIDAVFSTCPVLLEVQMEGSPTNNYNVYIQRLTPTLQAVNSYGVNGGDFVINALAGQQYLISADSKCANGTVSTLNIWNGNVSVKPTCTSPANLVLSNPTCVGFTASWNTDPCISNTVSGYDLYMRQAGQINYNSYGVGLPTAPVGPHELVNWLGQGKNMQVFVQSIYTCSGSVTYGPSSQIQTITTLSGGCRDEDVQQPEESKPAVQQYSTDNQEVFSLYPNPNTGAFTVNLSRISNEEDAVRIEVINMIGQTVITQLTTINDGHLNEYINLPNGTPAGTYIIRLTAGKNIYTAKMNISK